MNRSRVLIFPALFLISACVASQAPAPFTNYGAGTGGGSAGVHTVSAGETLWTISQRYHMEMRDIAMLNYLKAPFNLPPGTRLKLPPPLEYRVREGDTLYKVSRLFNASTTDIARLNNLPAPYTLSGGQMLRMPSPPPPPPQPYIASAAPVREMPKPVPAAPPHTLQVPPGRHIAAQPYVPPQSVMREALPPPVSQAPTPQTRVATNAPRTLQAPTKQSPIQPPMRAEPAVYHPPEAVKAVKQKITAETPKRASSKFLRPVSGRLISGYGPKKDGMHNDGMNIRAPKGTAIRAAENGVVVYAGSELKGSGNLVLIRHEGRWMTAYAHLDQMNIKRGDVVKRGQTIGTVGNTGSVSEPQLHFEVRRGTEAINPERFLEG